MALLMAFMTATAMLVLGSPVHLLPIGPEGLSVRGSLKVMRKSSGMSRLHGGLYSLNGRANWYNSFCYYYTLSLGILDLSRPSGIPGFQPTVYGLWSDREAIGAA